MAETYALAEFFGTARQELLAHIPHAAALGMQVLLVGPRTARVSLPYRPELVGDPVRRVVFGGVITTLLDQAAGMACFCTMPEMKPIATLDLRVDYLRAAEPDCDLIGEAHCYKLTQNIGFVRGSAWERTPDDPFATCIATFMIGSSHTVSPMAAAVKRGPQP